MKTEYVLSASHRAELEKLYEQREMIERGIAEIYLNANVRYMFDRSELPGEFDVVEDLIKDIRESNWFWSNEPLIQNKSIIKIISDGNDE